MDVQYELVRWESSALLGLESDSVTVSLPTFSAVQRKFGRRQGENTVNNALDDPTSVDELLLKQWSVIKNPNLKTAPLVQLFMKPWRCATKLC